MRKLALIFAVALSAAALVLPYAVANLLDNGDFESDVINPDNGMPDAWGTYGAVEASLSDDAIIGSKSLYIKVNEVGTNFWDSGLQNPGHVFQPGTYTLSAWLKAEEPRDINIKPELGANPWTGYGSQAFTMTTEWVEYHTTAEIPEVVDPGTITFHIAYSTAGFWIDNVRWVEGEFVPSEPGTAVEPEDKLTATWARMKSF